MEDFYDASKYFITVFSILNPIGAIPVFITLTRPYSLDELKKISTNCAITVFITLLISSIFGDQILSIFGIKISSFKVGGGIVIATTALSMLRAESAPFKMTQDEIDRQSRVREIGIVPLAIPMLAGPGAITTSIIESHKLTTGSQWIFAILALAMIAICVKLILSSSRAIRNKLGRVSLNVMTRVFGLILLAISVELIIGGLIEAVHRFKL